MHEAGASAGLAVVVVHVLQWLKFRQWFPWVTTHSDEATKVFAGFAAVLNVAGMTWSFDRVAGVATLAGIPTTPEAIIGMLLQVFAVYGGQKLYYVSAVKAVR